MKQTFVFLLLIISSKLSAKLNNDSCLNNYRIITSKITESGFSLSVPIFFVFYNDSIVSNIVFDKSKNTNYTIINKDCKWNKDSTGVFIYTTSVMLQKQETVIIKAVKENNKEKCYVELKYEDGSIRKFD